MTSDNPLQQLTSFGQSVWLDFIERSFVREGRLAALIRDDAVTGVTSNPAIFHKAIADHAAYQPAIEAAARQGLAAHEAYEALVVEDIQAAAEQLLPIFQRTGGRDGFVSLEVSPHFARDAEGTFWEATRLWSLVRRANLMIKVPGTKEGVAAVRSLIAAGINVNITLLFSVDRYAAVAAAFCDGLWERAARDLPIDRVASVASFFLSRIDTLLDPKLDAAGTHEARALRGQCAIACARAAYQHYQSTITSARWRNLRERGAQSQRLLWASTGTKDPAYSNIKYVEALVGPDTVTTLPPETLSAYREHGRPDRRLPGSGPSQEEIEEQLARLGIDWPALATQLETDGIRKFTQPHEAILATLRERIAAAKG